MYWRTKSFKALQARWYATLKDAGFEDHERLEGDDMVLKTSSVQPMSKVDILTSEAKSAYYSLLSECVADEDFDSDIDRIIMAMHSEGTKIKVIVAYLKEMGTGRTRETVRFTIRRYEHKWKIRSYSCKQMNKVSGKL